MSVLEFDHIVIAVSDLDESEQTMSRVLARTPSWRGRHPTFGTANVLYRLDNAYLELLAPDPQGIGLGSWPGLAKYLEERREGFYALALGADDLDAAIARARMAGIEADDAAPGEGVDLTTGAVRRWHSVRLPVEGTRGTPVMLIHHDSPRDALPVAGTNGTAGAVVKSIESVSIESAEAEGARKMWRDAFGLDETAASEGWRFELDNGSLHLRAGVGEADASDRWLRLVLGVESLTSTADRLDSARTAFGQGDFFEGYGLRLDVCGVDLLLIER